MGIHLSEI